MSKINPKIQIKNPSLQKLTKGINKKQILGVALDIGKEFHKAILFDFNAKIFSKPFPVNSLKSGYETLQKRIASAQKKMKAKKIIVGVETLGAYGENISRHLKNDYVNVYFINPFATASNRNQKLLLGLKTDDIDAACIGDLLIRGECFPYNLRDKKYLELKEKTYWRERKLGIVTMLKNQITTRMEKISPGLTSAFAENKPLFTRPFGSQIPKILMDLAMLPQDIINLTPEGLSKLCLGLGHNVGKKRAVRIIQYFEKLLIPGKNNAAINLEILKIDIRILKYLEKEMKNVENSMIELVKQTPGKILLNQIKGLSDIMVAIYIGCIGDIDNYNNANKIYSMAGLTPKIKQSGSNIGIGLGIKRSGNKFLRTILYKMAKMAIWQEPFFKNYYYKIRERKTWKESIIATANKLNRIMFAMMKRQQPFKPLTIENFGNGHKLNELAFLDEDS